MKAMTGDGRTGAGARGPRSGTTIRGTGMRQEDIRQDMDNSRRVGDTAGEDTPTGYDSYLDNSGTVGDTAGRIGRWSPLVVRTWERLTDPDRPRRAGWVAAAAPSFVTDQRVVAVADGPRPAAKAAPPPSPRRFHWPPQVRRFVRRGGYPGAVHHMAAPSGPW